MKRFQSSFVEGSVLQKVALGVYTWSDTFCAKLATATYTRSSEYARILKDEAGISTKGVMTQSSQYNSFFPLNPCDMEQVKASSKTRYLLTNGRPERPLLLYAGRFWFEKRISLLITAFRDATAQGLFKGTVADGCLLVLVGDGPVDLKQYHEPEEGVFVHQKFVTKIELRTYYCAADVHVSASNFETFGNTVHESLLCGTPVVVQRAGGYVTQVGSGERGPKQGFLVDFEDTTEVAKAVIQAVEMKMRSRIDAEIDIGPKKRDDTTEGTEIVSLLLNRDPPKRLSRGEYTRNLIFCTLMHNILCPWYEALCTVRGKGYQSPGVNMSSSRGKFVLVIVLIFVYALLSIFVFHDPQVWKQN